MPARQHEPARGEIDAESTLELTAMAPVAHGAGMLDSTDRMSALVEYPDDAVAALQRTLDIERFAAAQVAAACAGQVEALQHAEGLRAVMDGQLAQLQARHADELATVHAQVRQDAAELAALRAQAALAREGAQVFEAQQARIRDLEQARTAALQRAEALQQQVRRLEGELQDTALLLGNLQQDMMRMERLATDTQSALPGLAPQPLPERFLVRDEAGMEVGYLLGARTTLGRAPDNDIPIDETFVSRRHAVVHCTTERCVIEDLASTNGLVVNGRRVRRRTLRDGDNVALGKATLRFRQSP